MIGFAGTLRWLHQLHTATYPMPQFTSGKDLNSEVVDTKKDCVIIRTICRTVAVFGMGVVGINATCAACIFNSGTISAVDPIEIKL